MTQRQSQVKVSTTLNSGLLPIHVFAQLCRTTPRTIRFYEQKGLIKPTKVDHYNGYRYYDPLKAREFFRIKLLQNFEIPLNEMRSALPKLTKENFLKTQLKQIKEELEQKEKEYKFLKMIREFLFTGENPKKFLKAELVGPFILFSQIIEKGRYDQINNYITEMMNLAKKMGIKVRDTQLVSYLDHAPYKPKDMRLNIELITEYKSMPANFKLPQGYFFRYFPKTKMQVFTYKGPYEYIALIYQKIYEKQQQRLLKKHELGTDIHIFGPWNKKSPYDYLTKICFPLH